MAGKKVLTKRIIEDLLSDGNSADLSEFTEIEYDAAECLGRFWSNNLRLGGLTNISDEAVEALANNEDGLNLDGLATLTDAAAASLSKFKGRTLSLNGLKSLSDDAALSLSKYTGLALMLNGLTSLSDAAAESLGQAKCGTLCLNGLTSISDAAAESFCKRPSNYILNIKLEGLNSLADSPAQLELLRRLIESWYTIRLNNLASLSEAQAELLKNVKGNKRNSSELELNGLVSLTDSVAKILGKAKCSALFLNGLTSLSNAAAKGLSKFNQIHLHLNGLSSLTDAAAESLGKAKCGNLYLNGLTSLSDAAAESIRTFSTGRYSYTNIYLNGLTNLSDAAAKALSKQKSRLNLDGLTTLSDGAAKALAKRKGEALSLKGLQTLSDVAAKAFVNRKFYELSLSGNASTSVSKARAEPDGPRPERADPSGTITNSVGMKLVPISAGKFLMGSPENEEERFENELQHEVTLTNDFYLGMTQVTQSQYEQVMVINLSHFKGKEVSGRDSSEFPVEMVSWDDAVDFCRKLSEMPEEKAAGRVYRLPTEAEWEYACRAGSVTAFCFGNDEESLDEFAWYHEKGLARPRPVALKEPNVWGLHDMHGNVLEWCSDWYADYPKGAVADPVGPEQGSYRVFRGGSWDSWAEGCRSARRRWSPPSVRENIKGFRVALNSSGIPK